MKRKKALGPCRDKTLWKRLVTDRWDGRMPILSPDESVKAAKRLYRKALGYPWTGPVKVVSGNRRTWIRSGVLCVNPDEHLWNGNRGLREIIHSISHYAHQRLNPADAPHSRRQAAIEGKLTTYALNAGWAEGSLKPKPRKPKAEPVKAKPDKVQQRYQRICNRAAKWEAQLEQAERLLKKAKQEKRVYERRHGDRLKAA